MMVFLPSVITMTAPPIQLTSFLYQDAIAV